MLAVIKGGTLRHPQTKPIKIHQSLRTLHNLPVVCELASILGEAYILHPVAHILHIPGADAAPHGFNHSSHQAALQGHRWTGTKSHFCKRWAPENEQGARLIVARSEAGKTISILFKSHITHFLSCVSPLSIHCWA